MGRSRRTESNSVFTPKAAKMADLAVFVLFLAFNIYLLAVHEMWRDEVNVYLMGRDLSVAKLLTELRFQGHPCLWYLIVMPFAKLGLPCKIMDVISLIIMGCAAYIFYFRAPFNKILKAVALFIPMFSYYYTVIARGYCLVALFVILLAYYYGRRNDMPILYGILLALLCQADTIGVPIAGFISVMWLFEAINRRMEETPLRKAAIGLVFPLVSFAFYLFQMRGASDSTVYEIRDLGLSDTLAEFRTFAFYIPKRLFSLNEELSISVLIILLAFIIVISLKVKTLWPFVVFGGYVAFEVVFSVFVYELNIWHFLALAFVFIWMMWVYDDRYHDASYAGGKAYAVSKAVIGLVSFALCILSIYHWACEDQTSGLPNAVNGSYSDGVHAAAFIEENLSPDEVLVMANVPYVTPICAYAKDYKFYFAGSGKETLYADWSTEQCTEVMAKDVLKWVRDEFPEKDSFIYIDSCESYVSGDFADAGQSEALSSTADGSVSAQLLYQTQEPSARQEDYKIYRVTLR